MAQVRALAFAVIHSTTVVLPAWKRACQTHGLRVRLIPRDVRTRWNSTYDMLVFTLDYRDAVDDITGNRALKLRKYELDADEWRIIEELTQILEVRCPRIIHSKIDNVLLD